MLDKDTLSNVLYVDLTRKRSWTEERKDLFEKYLGGVGVGSKLLYEECPKNADPLSQENSIIFAVGPLNGFFPLASKTVSCFKSPLTNNYGESHAGGRSSIAIRLAGYGAIVIKGESNTPVYISIHGSNVQFKDASALWGLRSTITVGRVLRENEKGSGIRTIMRIGAAGENLVSYASVNTETYRHFGRLGLGAVFGSKKLKALVISGKLSLPVINSKSYREIYDEIFDYAVNSPRMRKYHELGTAFNVLPINEINAFPTMNLKKSNFNKAEEISGEHLAKRYLGRRVACSHCPVACIHIAALRKEYETEPYFYKTIMISYDYELIYALGSMVGIGNPEDMLRLMDAVEIYGLDAMSIGVVLSWITEAMEKGIVDEKKTLRKAEWSDLDSYLELLKNIVYQPNEFYSKLAKKFDEAVIEYGGEDYALTFGRNGLPGYHTGTAAYVNYLTGARHSHLDSAGYSIDIDSFRKGEKISPEDLAKKLFKEESWRQILSSLVICFFSRKIYEPDLVKKALEVVGYNLTEDELLKLGEEILKNKFEFKFREGFDFDELRIPKRIFETPTPIGVLKHEDIQKGIDKYKELIVQ